MHGCIFLDSARFIQRLTYSRQRRCILGFTCIDLLQGHIFVIDKIHRYRIIELDALDQCLYLLSP